MTDRIFLDTNIIVYAFDKRDAAKNITAKRLFESLFLTDNCCISTQVILEFMNVAFMKMKPPLTEEDVSRFTDSIPENKIVLITRDVIRQAILIRKENRYSVWDSLIVASALSSGCTILYSEDMSHDEIIGNLRICNPFL